jgi:hypothetical protein
MRESHHYKIQLISSIALAVILCGCTWGDLFGSAASARQVTTPIPLVMGKPTLPVQTAIPTVVSPTVDVPAYNGPLAEDVRAKLYQTSLNYVAPPGNPAKAVVHRLAYLNGIDEDPSNSCGPISEKFLEVAGLLPNNVYLHKFWILDAHTGSAGLDFLAKLFPETYYYWYQTDIRTSKFDFTSHPLYAGDWLYLFGGDMGFDHMLTVTHRDDQGRVYSVTNGNTPDGVEISEDLLYDPAQPHAGILYTWNDAQARGKLGTTGRGGFILIRKIDGTPDSIWNGAVSHMDLPDNPK